MTTKKEAEKRRLDTLAERVMRKVPCPVVDVRSDSHGNNPGPVHTPSHPCGGTGTVLDPRWAALREALWKESELIDIDPGLGYVRRSRAEADGWLMDALDKLGLEAEIQLHPSSCTVSVREEGRIYRSGKPLTDWLDALAAALMAWMDLQGVTA